MRDCQYDKELRDLQYQIDLAHAKSTGNLKGFLEAKKLIESKITKQERQVDKLRGIK